VRDVFINALFELILDFGMGGGSNAESPQFSLPALFDFEEHERSLAFSPLNWDRLRNYSA